MKAGREMDALVAEKVMGWEPIVDFPMGSGQALAPGWKGYWTGEWFRWTERPVQDSDEVEEPWSPSTDIAAAWEVLEKFPDFAVTTMYEGYVRKWAMVDNRPPYASKPAQHWAYGETFPHAICLAALNAVKAEVPA